MTQSFFSGGIVLFQAKRANFDATHELEELLLEDNPLKVKPKKKKNGEPIPGEQLY